MPKSTVVCIDPGHGGAQAGACYGAVEEKALNLSLALALAERLRARGLAVVLTRSDDSGLTLTERGRFSGDKGASLVISLHANASTSPNACGALAFHWPHSPLGEAFCHAFEAKVPTALRRTKVAHAATADLWPRVRNVLGPHAAPAVLVEVGFLSNTADREFLASAEGHKAVVDALEAATLAVYPQTTA